MLSSALLAAVALTTGFTSAQVRPEAGNEWATKYGIDLHAKAVYVNFEQAPRGIVFCFNTVANGDIYWHMSGPVTSSWIGVGFGTEMENALMFVSYPGTNGHNVTTGARIGTGHTEPAYDSSFVIEKIYNDLYAPSGNTITPTGAINSHVVCRNCSKWATGELDFYNTRQPMFWAMGPNKTFESDDPNANIDYHIAHGRFYADMTLATNFTGNYGRVPAPNIPDFVYPPTDAAFAAYGTTVSFDVEERDYKVPAVHGLLMIVAFLILFPMGALVKLILRRVMWHAAIQSTGVLLVMIGFGISIKMSRMFLRSKDFNSGHQLLGLFIIACIAIQFGLGITHHMIYARTKSPTILGRIHMFLGPIVMILGIINGGIGLRFGGDWEYGIAYGIVCTMIATVFIGLVGCVWLIKNRRKSYKAELDYEGPSFGPSDAGSSIRGSTRYSDIELHPPPSYGAEPPTPYEAPATANPFVNQQLSYEPPQAYAPIVPYHPSTAYTPNTPKTFTKTQITEYALRRDDE